MNSNQPKITYRSDSTGCTYQMMQQNGTFEVQVVDIDGIIKTQSPVYAYLFPWRKTINMFFDIVTTHINYNIWKA